MKRWLVTLAFAPLACGEGSEASPDAGRFFRPNVEIFQEDAGTMQRIELGTGFARYRPLTDGQEVELSRGPQGGGRWGGFHVWHAATLNGYNPHVTELVFRTYLADDLTLVATSTRSFNLEYVEDRYVVAGVAPPIADCCLAQNRELIMRVDVKDRDGRTGSDERRVRAGVCAEMSGGPSLCP